MKPENIRKVMIYDQAPADAPGEAFYQCMGKMQQLLKGHDVNFVRLCMKTENPYAAAAVLAEQIRTASPELVIIPATALGEEIAPALGIRLGSGVAAHCSDIIINGEGRIAYMVPAFGGKVIGEIFIPNAKPAIATVKPGVFAFGQEDAGEYDEIICNETLDESGPVVLLEEEEYTRQKNPIEKADIIICGGFGIGSKEAWDKIERLAELVGGAAGCTRPVCDMNWGPDECSMIGTSGKTVRPKLYVGFGISGAAHHLCGIKDSGVIVNVNCDKNAECFKASDYAASMDANAVLDSLLQRL